MRYNPLILFREENPHRAQSMFDLIRFLIVLGVITKFTEVTMAEGFFGGWDVSLTRLDDEQKIQSR